MSRKDVKRARLTFAALNDAFKAGDLRPFLTEFCDRQIVLKPAGIFPETAETRGQDAEMRGHDGMLRFATMQAEAFDEFHVEPLEYIDAGDRVVVPLRFGGRARHTGLDVEFDLS